MIIPVGSIHIANLEEGLKAQLDEIKLVIDDKILSETATFVKNEAKTTAAFKDKTGNLRKSIRKKKSKFEDGGYIVAASGKNQDKGFHAHLVEFGHAEYDFHGKPTGRRVPPNPFMRPAVEKGAEFIANKIRSSK